MPTDCRCPLLCVYHPIDFGQQIAAFGGLPRGLRERIEAIQSRDFSGPDCGLDGCEREVGHTGDHRPYYGLCDVGGCGNSATGPELAVYVPVARQFLEVSLCSDHPEFAELLRKGPESDDSAFEARYDSERLHA